MKKLLVTGGAGFIGSEFVRQGVRRGYAVVVVDKLTYAGDLRRIREFEKAITFYRADIIDRALMEHIFAREKPEAVIHWAAESHVDRSIQDASPFIETNIRGTQILLEISKHYGIERFINISTDEVYGELKSASGGGGRFHESDILNPSSPYSVSKASADMLGRAYFRTHGVPVITVRPSNTYGPYQYPEKLIPLATCSAIDNKPVPVYGKGENVREWLYVEDCVMGTYAVLEEGRTGEVYNMGSGQEWMNVDVVKRILSILGKPESLIEFVKDRPGHDFRYSLNTDKIKTELGFEVKTGFDEGLERTVRWYVENEGWWRRDKERYGGSNLLY
jgi:dTDP-glucose 4,6-dehydratase